MMDGDLRYANQDRSNVEYQKRKKEKDLLRSVECGGLTDDDAQP